MANLGLCCHIIGRSLNVIVYHMLSESAGVNGKIIKKQREIWCFRWKVIRAFTGN